MIEQINTKNDITRSMSPLRRELSDRLFGEINKRTRKMYVRISEYLLECIYTDHPTVGTLRNDQPADIVEPYYRFFLNRGVLHKMMESLVDHLNTIDMDTWWQSVVNSPEYMDFKQQFARPVNEESVMVE